MAESGIFNPPPFYKRAGFIRGTIIFLLFGSFIFLFRWEIINVWNQIRLITSPLEPEVIRSYVILIWNGLLFIVCFILFISLVSLFLLPTQNTQQRRKVLRRLIDYLLGQHGPAVFIKEGKKIAKESELLSSKPGVAFIDLTSAMALEKQSPPRATPTATRISTTETTSTSVFSPSHIFDRTTPRLKKGAVVRIAGPGITFTEAGEKIRGVIDLRPQVRFRRNVRAYTQEGIEIETSITTIFTIGQPPETIQVVYTGEEKAENLRTVLLTEKVIRGDDEATEVKKQVIEKLIDGLDTADKEEIHRFVQNYRRTGSSGRSTTTISKSGPSSPFLFDPARIFSAIYASSLDINEDGFKEWTELPPYLATELFRNMIGGEIYDYLYFPADPRIFPLQDFKSNFAMKMRYQGVLSFQFVERKSNVPFAAGQEWDEDQLISYPEQELRNPKVLRARGIKVIHASFSDLTPVNPGVRGQLLDNWSAYWESEAQQTLVEYELKKTRILNEARIDAQTNLKDSLMDLLESSSLADDALALRMLQALENVAADPATREFLPKETIEMLNSIWKWLLPEGKREQLPSGPYSAPYPIPGAGISGSGDDDVLDIELVEQGAAEDSELLDENNEEEHGDGDEPQADELI